MILTDINNNLTRIANALEELAGKKTFIPDKSKPKIEVVERTDEDEKEIVEKEEERIANIMGKNEGKHLWEETNLEETEQRNEY